jgi:hypothetical protein
MLRFDVAALPLFKQLEFHQIGFGSPLRKDR